MQENVFFFLKAKNSVKYLYDNISVEDGLALMRKHKYTAMPIINKEGVYVGTITEGDFLWYLLDHPSIHKEDLEQIAEYHNSIFWSFDLKNYRKSTWWVKNASTDIKDKITIRTANTIEKLLDLCQK